MKNILVLFDIDGTLLHVAEEVAFAQTFHDLYGDGVDLSWPNDAPVSDVGFITAVVSRQLGRPAREADVARVVDRFVYHLERLIADGTTPVRRLRGVEGFIEGCTQTAAVAIATGCVEPSARVKLRHAELLHHFPCGGFSQREAHRREIVERAIRAAEHHYQRGFEPTRIVSVGDGTWDVDVARHLGLRFVGINESEEGRRRLRRAGATTVLADYTDADSLWAALEFE
jgi:phosphoglycolate phosphatase-like HAD superfamily hydrolase